MSVLSMPRTDARSEDEILPPLRQGDRLDQPTFHARYEAMPADVRAELIGGVVYMPSPMLRRHGVYSRKLSGWLDRYEAATPGVEGADNATIILGDESEPQPDHFLLICPDRGGQTRVDDRGFYTGAPELVVEVAYASESYDLHAKKHDYERGGVHEYLVVLIRERRVLWFLNRGGGFEAMEPSDDGLCRSGVFPGLWLDPAALFGLDSRALQAALQKGLATSEHAAFVDLLAARAAPVE